MSQKLSKNKTKNRKFSRNPTIIILVAAAINMIIIVMSHFLKPKHSREEKIWSNNSKVPFLHILKMNHPKIYQQFHLKKIWNFHLKKNKYKSPKKNKKNPINQNRKNLQMGRYKNYTTHSAVGWQIRRTNLLVHTNVCYKYLNQVRFLLL